MDDRAELNAGAIVKAVAIAITASFALTAIAVFVVVGWAFASAFMGYKHRPSSLLGFFFCLSEFTDVLAGYLAAKFAGRNELLHGLVAGIGLLVVNGLCYLLQELFLLPDHPHHPLLVSISFLLTVPLAVVGAVIRKRTG